MSGQRGEGDRATFIATILDLGATDYVASGELYSLVLFPEDSEARPYQEPGESQREAARLQAWGAAAEVLIRGLMELGDLSKDGTFVARQGPIGEVLVTALAAWHADWHNGSPRSGAGEFWLRNTPAGNDAAAHARSGVA